MTILRHSFRTVLLLLPCWFGACTTSGGAADLATNGELYVDVPFTTKAPGDRQAFVAPVADARGRQAPPQSNRGFPIVYGNDSVWDRPVPEMVAEVLHRQIAGSKLFAGLDDAPGPATILVLPTIVSFQAGAVQSVSGCSSFADVGLRLQVFGPAGANGARALLLDEVFADRQATEVAMSPINPYRLVGGALRVSIGKALVGIDGSNAGRSQVPLDVAAPPVPVK
ncbi:MAG: hypothetical protein FJ265_17345 [Planctomycetes bacterium]|nr:hypothetical protein [Planctomycetota bacterium]